MPKITRSSEEIDNIKKAMLEAALKLFLDEGFSNFSMRKLALKLGMTAANIYNYYSNKDEIYLLIQTRGFEILYTLFDNIYKSNITPVKKLHRMAEAYISFGTENPDYYDIMFSRNTPKYTDYLGTAVEPVAFREKQTALKVAAVTGLIIGELLTTGGQMRRSDTEFKTIQLWSILHGAVNLHNSRVLQEVSKDTGKIFKRIIRESINSVTSIGK